MNDSRLPPFALSLGSRLLAIFAALWLAFQLVSWLRWAWACAREGGAWRALPRRAARPVLRPERREAPEPVETAAADGEPPPLPGTDVRAD